MATKNKNNLSMKWPIWNGSLIFHNLICQIVLMLISISILIPVGILCYHGFPTLHSALIILTTLTVIFIFACLITVVSYTRAIYGKRKCMLAYFISSIIPVALVGGVLFLYFWLRFFADETPTKFDHTDYSAIFTDEFNNLLDEIDELIKLVMSKLKIDKVTSSGMRLDHIIKAVFRPKVIDFFKHLKLSSQVLLIGVFSILFFTHLAAMFMPALHSLCNFKRRALQKSSVDDIEMKGLSNISYFYNGKKVTNEIAAAQNEENKNKNKTKVNK